MIVTRTVIVYLDSFVKVADILDLEPIFVQKVISIGAHYLETPKCVNAGITLSNILILNSFFSENLVADVRIWECAKFPNWLQKTYRVKAADFCKAQWDDRYFSSQPQCNDKVLPTIAFYDRSNNNYDGDSLCTINLNKAEDGNIDKLCPELDSILNSSFEGKLKMLDN